MNKRLLAISFLAAIQLSSAPWILIDDFESFEAGVYYYDQLPYPAIGNYEGYPIFTIMAGTPGTGGTKAAWFGYGTFAGGGQAIYQLPLPAEIEPNGLGTVTFRVWTQSYDIGYYMMLSRTASGEELDDSLLFSHQAAIVRLMPGSEYSPIDLEARDNDAYAPSFPTFIPSLFTWYTYWIVADNAFDPIDPSVSTGGYEVYVQGPADPAPVLLAWGADPGHSELAFRNQEHDSIKTLCLGQVDVAGSYIWLIDDVYYSPGYNLTSFKSTGWCSGESIDGPLDTGAWLGWLYPMATPTGPPFWAWSYSLNRYLYVSDCPDAGGAWVFLP